MFTVEMRVKSSCTGAKRQWGPILRPTPTAPGHYQIVLGIAAERHDNRPLRFAAPLLSSPFVSETRCRRRCHMAE
jgi:hypothetical protein